MIPVAEPLIARNAKKYVLEALSSGWISSKGPFVEKFEEKFAKFVDNRYGIATNSGTAALHLALAAINIGPGDEVIVPSYTMIAAALPIIYQGATPVLVDVELNTGNIDTSLVEERITKKTRAIIIVHLNGHPADMSSLLALGIKYNLPIIEDVAEAHGAEYRLKNNIFKKVGSLGSIGCFSFYANKIVTTGEGGMVVTNERQLAEKLRSLRNFARSKNRHFYHREIAFAYRMSNLQAALGLAQLEEVNLYLQKKGEIASLYLQKLGKITLLTLPIQKDYARRIYWQFEIQLPSRTIRDSLAMFLARHRIETRTSFIPLHKQPAFLKRGFFKGQHFPAAEDLSNRGLCLPSGLKLKKNQINYVCGIIQKFVDENS